MKDLLLAFQSSINYVETWNLVATIKVNIEFGIFSCLSLTLFNIASIKQIRRKIRTKFYSPSHFKHSSNQLGISYLFQFLFVAYVSGWIVNEIAIATSISVFQLTNKTRHDWRTTFWWIYTNRFFDDIIYFCSNSADSNYSNSRIFSWPVEFFNHMKSSWQRQSIFQVVYYFTGLVHSPVGFFR
jgi:hypothetical protein